MKKKILNLALIFSVAFGNIALAAKPIEKIPAETLKNMTEAEKINTVNETKARVMEIKNMDMSTLTKVEKQSLKKELRNAEVNMKRLDSKVTISLGAIIIIILLLIIIL